MAKRDGTDVPLPPPPPGPESRSVSEVLGLWLAREAQPATIARDTSLADKWIRPAFGDRAIGDVTRTDVRAFVTKLTGSDLSVGSVRSYYGRLAAFFSFAEEADMITVSPCRKIKLPEGRRTKRPAITTTDLHRLADCLPEGYAPVAYLAALGLRRAEIFGLQVRDLDFLRGCLTVERTANVVRGHLLIGQTKTEGSERTIQVPAEVMQFLGAFLAEQDRTDPHAHVVQAPNGGPVRADLFRRRVWQSAVTEAGMEGLGLHDLRHAATAWMYDAGVPLEVTSKRLGHSSIRTTADVYGRLSEAADKQAAANLGSLFSGGQKEATSSVG